MVWKIWTKIYCSARNLLVHHSSLSHTTYMETKYASIETTDEPDDLSGVDTDEYRWVLK